MVDFGQTIYVPILYHYGSCHFVILLVQKHRDKIHQLVKRKLLRSKASCASLLHQNVLIVCEEYEYPPHIQYKEQCEVQKRNIQP